MGKKWGEENHKEQRNWLAGKQYHKTLGEGGNCGPGKSIVMGGNLVRA